MSFVADMKAKAVIMQKKLVLPEGTEARTLAAARIIIDEKIASEVFLVGDTAAIKAAAADESVSLDGLTVVDPSSSALLDTYAQEYHELRKHKGLSLEDAKEQIKDNLKWGAMMVRKGDADAMVAGADNPTGKVLVAGFTIIKTSPGVSSASSCFVMDFPEKKWGQDGLMIFSDCATIPDPTVDQLAEITIQSSVSCKTFLQVEPLTAMLSFSTKGSASHPNVDKVTDALKIVKERAPELNVDGEMQLDAAIVESVGAKKAPGSSVAGKANTLIFPDLQSGNIGYKLAQRFGNAGAYGPFLQGFAKPISDLSRGCSVEDIVNTVSVTMTQVED
ncbi:MULTISPECIES: phosphate acetyltransferase [unclassified Oceanispirochaeta]|uniref:phosphate acetyltransferase n=1 Tax=unclassified Oceanispirochaeta TaxID=2635722 RepID=UPI000E090449|nr:MULTISPECIES: phosphate acetyltransferase [unclassified Oceanispirochaeta]MBF9015696.1 phosphate acetyltransferase [Oceanispirochaeta sp. M2]NPD72161.1 phosphate acetyltransferase [Oceanispirochaeta sp. M1]RDG32259.1 phosphate acetyltransferase [Oceanispirochaeta sp. M1]